MDLQETIRLLKIEKERLEHARAPGQEIDQMSGMKSRNG
jgi:hypothetical protein